jgi:hypothetical protein
MRTQTGDPDRSHPISLARNHRAIVSLIFVSPLLFGVPVVLGIVRSVANMLGTSYPYLGWATTVNADAAELYLGHTIYQNPADGYTGLLYTPLFPGVVSVLDHLYFWGGWSVLLVIGATVALASLAGRIAYAPRSPLPALTRLLAAAGIGGVAYWCLSSMQLPLLAEGRSDEVAWAFALFGLVAVADFGPAPSRQRVVLAALLLTAALWTKQSTIGIAVLAGAWVCWLAALLALNRSAARLFLSVLGGLNLALLAVLNLLTGGWEFYFNFEMPLAQWTDPHYWPLAVSGLEACELMAGFVGVAWLATTVAAVGNCRRSTTASQRRRAAFGGLRKLLAADDPTGRRALLFGLYTILGFVLAVYFRRKQGTYTNQFIGIVWTLGLFAAVGWRLAQRHINTAVATGGCLALFFALTQVGPIRATAVSAGVYLPPLERVHVWREVPSELRTWAADHTLYSPQFSEINAIRGGPLYPDYYEISDLLAAGRQPMYLVRALLNRSFESVEYFPFNNLYTSAHGKCEENYLWKLDYVMDARYMKVPELPPGILVRRPGPERAAWMRYCFGPFAVDDASFRIGHGGGFWCSFSPNNLNLELTRTPLSEVLTTRPVRAGGTIAIQLSQRASSQVDLVVRERTRRWRVRVAASPAGSRYLTVATYLGGTALGSSRVVATRLSNGRRGLQLSLVATRGRLGAPLPTGPGAATVASPATSATVALIATQGTEVNLNAMRF